MEKESMNWSPNHSRNGFGRWWLAMAQRIPVGRMLRLVKPKTGSSRGGGGVGDVKMVLVVRNDLEMSVGKVASQVAHGAVMAYAKQCVPRG